MVVRPPVWRVGIIPFWYIARPSQYIIIWLTLSVLPVSRQDSATDRTAAGKNNDAIQETRQVFLGLQNILDKTEKNQPETRLHFGHAPQRFLFLPGGAVGWVQQKWSGAQQVSPEGRHREIWGYFRNAILSPSDIGLSIKMHPGLQRLIIYSRKNHCQIVILHQKI